MTADHVCLMVDYAFALKTAHGVGGSSLRPRARDVLRWQVSVVVSKTEATPFSFDKERCSELGQVRCNMTRSIGPKRKIGFVLGSDQRTTRVVEKYALVGPKTLASHRAHHICKNSTLPGKN